MTRVLLLRSGDDVAVAVTPLEQGEQITVDGDAVAVQTAIPAGHKVAVRAVPTGHGVRKYGPAIGVATTDIGAGDHVHSHNLAFQADGPRATATTTATGPEVPGDLPRTFMGYRRDDGRAATRNYIGIVTSVNCASSTASMIARKFDNVLDDYDNIDGVVALTHDSGCGMVLGSEGAKVLERTLLNTALHPNFAALIVVGLGCEMLLAKDLFTALSGSATEVLLIQEHGGVRGTVQAGVDAVNQLLPRANAAVREPIGVEELVLSVKCGGSDGYSGISANRALGHAADLLVACGGRVVIGETPEVYGAEHLLISRAVSPDVAARLGQRIEWWKEYTAAGGGTLDNNPSPGNKAGGLTTILEKSLGAVAKAGSSPLADVVGYAEPVTRPGLTFMDTPGYDPVSVTGMIAGGANVVVFTTGRGSMFGSRPSPCIKVATNTPMFDRLSGDMDLNAGRIIDGTETITSLGEEMFRLIVDVASGRQTASEELLLGGEEFVPWQLGAVV